MSSQNALRDANYVPSLLAESSSVTGELVRIKGDSITGRLLVDSATGAGSVTDVSVVTTNGFAGSVATSTTTPAITLSTTITGILQGNGTAISAASTTGSGAVVLATSPQLVTPLLGTPTSGILSNCTGYATGSLTGLGTGVATALSVNIGTAGSFLVNGGALGTPSSGTLTNATGLPIIGGTTGTLTVARGGTGVATLPALSVWVANTLDTVTTVSPGAGNSIRVNAGGTAWEEFTPSASVPTTITVANEATDTTCFLGFFTAATGDLGPKTNTNLTFNSNTGVLTLGQTASGSITGNAGTATALAAGRTIAITGDLAYTSGSFDGTGNVTGAGTLATVNSNVGSFTNASITVNAKGLITAASNGTGGGGITWTEVTTTSQSAAVNNGYIANNAGLVTVTLPSTAAVGSIVRVAGSGAGGWRIAQNASGAINFGNQVTTTGTGGRLDSVNRYDAVELICITANNIWTVISSQGNITVT